MNIAFCHALENALVQHGVHIKGNIDYNKDGIQRFQDANKHKGRDLFVILHGEEGATFGDWHDQSAWVTWFLNFKATPNPREIYAREQRKQEMQQKRIRRRENAILRATNFWYNAPVYDNPNDHPYAKQKQITAYYSKKIKHMRWIRQILIVPIRNIDHELQSVQLIKANGFKRPWKGTTYKGNMIWLSRPLYDGYNGNIRVCEGYATGCTILEAIADPVVCALSAANLPDVAIQLRRKYVHANIMICADNDYLTPTPPGNIGLKYAIEAARFTGGTLHYPDFTGLQPRGKVSDYNDLFAIAGMDEVRRQLIIKRKAQYG